VEKWSDRRRFLEEAWGGTNGGINRGNKGKFLGNIQERVRSWFLDQLGREVGLCSEGMTKGGLGAVTQRTTKGGLGAVT